MQASLQPYICDNIYEHRVLDQLGYNLCRATLRRSYPCTIRHICSQINQQYPV